MSTTWATLLALFLTPFFAVDNAHAICVVGVQNLTGSPSLPYGEAQTITLSIEVTIFDWAQDPGECDLAPGPVRVGTVRFYSTGLFAVSGLTPDANGVFSTTAVIPANTPAGSYRLHYEYKGACEGAPCPSPTRTTFDFASGLTYNIVIRTVPQSLLFTTMPPSPGYVGGSYAVGGTGGGSGNPVTFSIADASADVCSLHGNLVALTGAGTCTVIAHQDGDGNHTAAPPAQQSFAVQAIPPDVPSIGRATAGDAQARVGFVPPGANGGAAITSYTVTSSPGGITGTGTAPPITVTGLTNGTAYTFAVTATNAAGTGLASAASNSVIPQASQSISFSHPGAQVLGTAPTLVASATSGLAVSFLSQTTSVCTVAGAVVSLRAEGTCTIQAQQAGNAAYLPATPVTHSFAVGKVDQTISFTSSAPAATVGGPSYAPMATATSGLPVTLSIDIASAGICVMRGAAVNFTAPGTCIINADQAGNAIYNVAARLQQSVAIQAVPPDAPAIGHATAGDAQARVGFVPPASNGGAAITSYTVTSSPGGITGTGTASPITVTGLANGTAYTFAVTATNAAGTGLASAASNSVIPQGSQSISFSHPGAQALGRSPTLVASATSGLAVSFLSQTTSVCTVSGAVVSLLTEGRCTIQAQQAGNTVYLPATPVTHSFAVGKIDQTISFTSSAPAATVGGPSYTPMATATSGLPVALTIDIASAGVCAMRGAAVRFIAAGTCIINADQAGNANYSVAARLQQSVTVGRADQSITFTSSPPTPGRVGDTYTVAATGGASGTPVTFSIASASSEVCAIAGTVVTFTGAGACTVLANQGGSPNYNAAPQQAQSITVSLIAVQVTLRSSQATGLLGERITFSASVTPSNATGTMTFLEGATPICASVAVLGGTAMCTVPFSDAGSHNIIARFNGTGPFDTSTSNAVAVAVVDQRARTTQVIGQFLGQRNNQILSNQPDASRQVDRLQDVDEGSIGENGARVGFAGDRVPGQRMAGFAASGRAARMGLGFASPLERDPTAVGASTGVAGEQPDFFAGRDQQGAPNASFAMSLSQMRRGAGASVQQNGLGISAGSNAGAPPKFNPFDFWVEGKYASFKQGHDHDGHFGLLSVGADYVFNRNLLAGVMVQFDDMRQTSNKDRSGITGTGVMAGPYATVRLTDRVFMQMRGAWGRSDNTIRPFLTYTDSFESIRWLFASTLTGSWSSGAWRFTPSATIAYMQDTTASYRDTFGVLIPSVESKLGQAKVGPRISYRSAIASGTIFEPYAGMDIVWNFADALNVPDVAWVDGDAAGPAGVRGRLELGLRSTTAAGIRIDVSGSYDGIGTGNYEAWTARASAHVPLQ